MNLPGSFGSVWQQVAALIGAFVLAVLITPIFRRIAMRFDLVDRPDPHRKLHREPIALSGGVAVLISLALAAGLATLYSPDIRAAALANPLPVLGLSLAALGIVILGLIDDAVTLRGRQKLMGQVLLCGILVLSGFQMRSVSLFGMDFELGILMIPITMGWLLLAINALNLIDGADGLCSTVGWTASAGIAAMATLGHHTVEASIAAALCGALLGFLVYNFPPAKIFLGDAGSMLIGLILGALALRTSLKGPTAISLLGSVAILAIPVFDSSMAIVRRKLTGRSIFTVDRGHLHHNLLRAGVSNHQLVALMTLMCGIIAIGAFAGAVLNSEALTLISIMTVLGSLVASRVFGFAELKLVLHRGIRFGSSLLHKPSGTQKAAREQKVRLQGVRAWENIWDTIAGFAEKHDLGRVCLDLNVPWLHEGFHASWQKNKIPDIHERWRTSLPIISNARILGRLDLMGPTQNANFFDTLGQLAELMESLQPEIDRLIAEAPASGAVTQQVSESKALVPEPYTQYANGDSDPNLMAISSSEKKS